METHSHDDISTTGSGAVSSTVAAGSAAMAGTDAFETLKLYFETRAVSKLALGALRPGVEIGVKIGAKAESLPDQAGASSAVAKTIDCALFQKDGQPKVELRPAVRPDIVFSIRPESVYVLSRQESDDVGEVGIAIFKEILAGNVQVKVLGGVMSILSGGYLEILKRGGSKFAGALTAQGLSGAGRIMAAIKKLRG